MTTIQEQMKQLDKERERRSMARANDMVCKVNDLIYEQERRRDHLLKQVNDDRKWILGKYADALPDCTGCIQDATDDVDLYEDVIGIKTQRGAMFDDCPDCAAARKGPMT